MCSVHLTFAVLEPWSMVFTPDSSLASLPRTTEPSGRRSPSCCARRLSSGLCRFSRTWSGWAVSAILAFLWARLALAYDLAFFASINPLAYVFAAVSGAGALVFVWQGCQAKSHFQFARSARVAVGAALVVSALFIYPAWSVYSGHGTLPCPHSACRVQHVVHHGLARALGFPYPRSAPVVPVLCPCRAQAAFLLGVWQDLGLLLAAAVSTVLIARSSCACRASLL